MAGKRIARAKPGCQNMETTVVIEISKIRLDGDTQPRCEIDTRTVDEYAEDILRGDDLPAIKVVHDGVHYWPWDGFHRLHAHRKAGKTTIKARVSDGTVQDARWWSLSVNRTHGLRRSIADKRRAVELALASQGDLSDRAIAEHCGVSHTFVARIRQGEKADQDALADSASADGENAPPGVTRDRDSGNVAKKDQHGSKKTAPTGATAPAGKKGEQGAKQNGSGPVASPGNGGGEGDEEEGENLQQASEEVIDRWKGTPVGSTLPGQCQDARHQVDPLEWVGRAQESLRTLARHLSAGGLYERHRHYLEDINDDLRRAARGERVVTA